MGPLSFFHWIVTVVFLFIYIFPVAMIMKKAGYSGWWCLLGLVPLLNIIMIWVFAFATWPNLRESQG